RVGAGKNFEIFGLQLFRELSKTTKENIFISPASISMALSMATLGASQRTLSQLLQVLNVTSIDDINCRSASILSTTARMADDKIIQIHLANRIYIEEQFHLREEFIERLEEIYLTTIKSVRFSSKTQTIKEVNHWIEEQTNKLIKNMLNERSIDRDTVMVIINCIYFKVAGVS
ncbi:unnamed protein product, partial [Didymodactylos carnosus]